jgi:hypothetical protein
MGTRQQHDHHAQAPSQGLTPPEPAFGQTHSHAPGAGHNHLGPPRRAAQWQTPHRLQGEEPDEGAAGEADLDLVESAFVESFAGASDPVSFLRLAQVPFEIVARDGHRLVLLRVETDEKTDVGAIMPHLGGGTFRYDPLTARLISRRRTLSFAYYDGHTIRRLNLAEVRAMGVEE